MFFMQRIFTFILFLVGTFATINAANYYSVAAAIDPTMVANWNTMADGSGTAPANFTTTGDVFIIQSGHTMTAAGAWAVTGNTIQVDGILTEQAAITCATFQVNAGGIYNHDIANGLIPGTTKSFPSNMGNYGTVVINAWVNNTTVLPTINYGNLTINVTGLTGNWQQAAALVTINGTLNIQSTGSAALRLTASVGATLTVGAYTQSGGTVELTSGASASTLKVAGTFNQTGGSIIKTGAGVGTIEFNGSSLQNVTLGTISNSPNFGISNSSSINLTGTMAIGAAASLIIASAVAEPIANTSSGSVTYNATAILQYTGTANQSITDKVWPTTSSPTLITINNTGTAPTNKVVLNTTAAREFNAGTFTLTTGVVEIVNQDLVFGATSGTAATLTVTGAVNKMFITTGTGYLKKYFGSGGNFSFPVGDDTGTREYAEVYMYFSLMTPAIGTGSYVGVRCLNTTYPGDAPTGDYISRHFIFTHENSDAASKITTGVAYTGTHTVALDLGGQTADVTGTITNVRMFRSSTSAISWIQMNSSGATATSPLGIKVGNQNAGTARPTSDPLNAQVYTGRQYLGQQTYVWNGSVMDGLYTSAANWTPARASTDDGDILQFNASATVTAVTANQSIGKLVVTAGTVSLTGAGTFTIGGGSATGDVDVLNVAASSKLSLNGTYTIQGPSTATTRTAAINGELEIGTGTTTISSANLTTVTFSSTGILTVPSTATGGLTNSAGAAYLVFQTGATYNHLRSGGTVQFLATYNTGTTINVGTSSARLTGHPTFTFPTTLNANLNYYANNSSTFMTMSVATGGTTINGTVNVDNSNLTGVVTFSGTSANTWTFAGATTFNATVRLNTASTSATAPVYNFTKNVSPSLNVSGGSLEQVPTTSTIAGFTTVNITKGITFGNNAILRGNTNTGAVLSGDLQLNINGGDVTFGTGTTWTGLNPSTANSSTGKTQISFLAASGDQNFTPPVTTTGRTSLLASKAAGNVNLLTRNLTTNSVSLTTAKLLIGNNNLIITAVGTAATSGSLTTGTGWVVTDGTGAVTITTLPISYSSTKNKIGVGSSTTSFDPIVVFPYTTASTATVSVKNYFGVASAPRDSSLLVAPSKRVWTVTTPSTNYDLEFAPNNVATAGASATVGKFSAGAWTELTNAAGGTYPYFAHYSVASSNTLYAVADVAQGVFAPLSLTSGASGNFTSSGSWSPAFVPASVDNLTIGHAITLDAAATCKNLTFTGANKLTLGANDMTATGTVTGGSSAGYVVTDGSGKLKIKNVTGGGAKTFPIGTSSTSYDPAVLTPTTTSDIAVKVSATFANAVLDAAKVLPREWDITPTTPSSTTLALTHDAAATAPSIGTVVLGHYTAGAWNETDVTSPAYNAGTRTYSGTCSTFSPFGGGVAGGFAAVLSIEFLSINAQRKGSINVIDWTTANEQNISEFAIERSTNNREWTVVGTQKATGGAKTTTYSFNDATPSLLNYYRIRSIETTGKSNVSKVVAVKRDGGKFALIAVSPIPTIDDVTIDFVVTKQSKLTATITDIVGKVVKQQTIEAVEGNNSLRLSLNHIATGAYILSVNDGDSIVTQRIVKQ
jgi:Secretion system C-terminal sorting domain